MSSWVVAATGLHPPAHVGWKCFVGLLMGLVRAQGASRLTESFTGTHYGPVQEIARAARTGPATTVLAGTASGLESSVYAIIAIAVAIGAAIGLGGGNLQVSLYFVALTGMGMLATTGVIVSEDTFGPVADNAAGIAEMSGEFSGEAERIMVSLDPAGNTTKAVTKSFATAPAVIVAVALFAPSLAAPPPHPHTAGAERGRLGHGEEAQSRSVVIGSRNRVAHARHCSTSAISRRSRRPRG